MTISNNLIEHIVNSKGLMHEGNNIVLQDLALFVQMLDSIFYQINNYPLDKC